MRKMKDTNLQMVRIALFAGLFAMTLFAFLLPSRSARVSGDCESTGPIPSVPHAMTSIPKSQPVRYMPGELIVKFRSREEVLKEGITTNWPSVNALLYRYKASDVRKIFSMTVPPKTSDVPDLTRYYLISLPKETNLSVAAAEFEKNPNIEFVTLNYLATLCDSPSDPYYKYQWPLNDAKKAKLRLPEAWDIATGSSDVVVAVVDTGFDVTHIDLAGKRTAAGYDFAEDDFGVMDEDGHGTCVAGIIAAVTNNNEGVAGVSWGAKIMPVKVCKGKSSSLSCSLVDFCQGLEYAADNGADIINMSMGWYEDQIGGFGVLLLTDAINYAASKGVILIASSGNMSTSTPLYPSALDHVISVGAVNQNDERCAAEGDQTSAINCSWGKPATGSGYGPTLDVMAPGSMNIWTTDIMGEAGYMRPGDYFPYFGGTSAAAAHVSGLAALILSINPNLTPEEVENIIELAADDQVGNPSEDTPGWDQYYGWGRINAYRALRLTPPATPITLDFTALLQGRTPPQGSGNHSTEVTIEVRSPDSTETLFRKTVQTDASGRYFGLVLSDIGGVNVPGMYDIYATPKYHLRTKKTMYLSLGTNTVDFSDGGTNLLKGGDFNEDNKINSLDIAILYSDWDPINNLRSDINADGVVNSLDYSFLVSNYGTAGDGWFSPSSISQESGGDMNQASLETQASASMGLIPPGMSLEFNTGDEVDFELALSTQGLDVDGVDAIIEYDPGVLEVLSVNPTAIFPNVHVASADPLLGEVLFSASMNHGTTLNTGIASVTLAIIRFRVISNPFEYPTVTDTHLRLRYTLFSTTESVVAEHGTGLNVLESSTGTPMPLFIQGMPLRELPTVNFIEPPIDPRSIGSPPGAISNRDVIPILVDVDDPFNYVAKVVFKATYGGTTEYIGEDTDKDDGWGIRWDVTDIPDYWGISIWAYAYLGPDNFNCPPAASERRTLTLDRMPPTLVSYSFSPPSPSSSSLVTITVGVQDQNSRMDHISVYVNSANDGSIEGDWNLIGTSQISSISSNPIYRDFSWDTSQYIGGTYRIIIEREDRAGNLSPLIGESEPVITYTLTTCTLFGDLDNDADVDVDDIMLVASRWRTSCDNPDPDNNPDTPNYESHYDLDGDCDIDIVDIMLVVTHWGETCE